MPRGLIQLSERVRLMQRRERKKVEDVDDETIIRARTDILDLRINVARIASNFHASKNTVAYVIVPKKFSPAFYQKIAAVFRSSRRTLVALNFPGIRTSKALLRVTSVNRSRGTGIQMDHPVISNATEIITGLAFSQITDEGRLEGQG